MNRIKVIRFLKGSTRSKIIKQNIIASLFVKGVSIVVQLALVPLTIGYVSKEIYGIWLTLSSVVLWLNFFDVGFTLGLKNRLGEAIANQDWERGKKLVSTTYFMMMVIFIPITIICCCIIPYINWSSILNVSSVYNDSIIITMIILMICFGCQMISNVISSVVSAYQQTALASSFPVIGNLISLLTIFILTKTVEPSLWILGLSISVFPILILIVAAFVMFNGQMRNVCPSIKYIDRTCISDLFDLGLKFFIIQLQMVAMYQSTNFLISNISGPEEVTNYNIAYKYLSVAMMAFNIILGPLWPAFTNAYTKKDYTWMNMTYKKMVKLYFIVSVIIVLMVLVSPFVYNVWVGDEVSVPMVMTVIVACYTLISSWDNLQVMLINGIGKIKLQSYVTLIGLFFNIPLSLYLGHHMGAIGVVVSMSVINGIYAYVFSTQISRILRGTAQGIWNK